MKHLFKNSDTYDIEACKPILEILESYFLDIQKAHEFQESTINHKRGELLEIALQIDATLTHPK